MATHMISVLNDLIATSKDGEQSFRKAAEDVHNTGLKQVLLTCSQDCRHGASELQNTVQRLGGRPEQSSSLAGALQRGWADVKATVVQRDDHAVLAECEKAEDLAKQRYRAALDRDLPADIRLIVERQYQGVIENHDRIRALRDQFAVTKIE